MVNGQWEGVSQEQSLTTRHPEFKVQLCKSLALGPLASDWFFSVDLSFFPSMIKKSTLIVTPALLLYGSELKSATK